VTRDDVRAVVLRVLRDVAPEADVEALDPGIELREQVDLDSMDVLSVMVGLHRALDVEIPESDYPKLATLGGCVEYLTARVTGSRES
jgi:acyl carrier protein